MLFFFNRLLWTFFHDNLNDLGIQTVLEISAVCMANRAANTLPLVHETTEVAAAWLLTGERTPWRPLPEAASDFKRLKKMFQTESLEGYWLSYIWLSLPFAQMRLPVQMTLVPIIVGSARPSGALQLCSAGRA